MTKLIHLRLAGAVSRYGSASSVTKIISPADLKNSSLLRQVLLMREQPIFSLQVGPSKHVSKTARHEPIPNELSIA